MPILMCDPKEPERIAEALKLVAILVRGDKVEMAKHPLHGTWEVPGYYEALQATAAHGRLVWMIAAREQWLELAIKKWREWADANTEKLSEIVDFRKQVPREGVDGAHYDLISQYLNPAWILESHKLMDWFLVVLKKFPHDKGTPNRAEIRGLIQRRTGCARENDPHRDAQAYDLLLKYHGLD